MKLKFLAFFIFLSSVAFTQETTTSREYITNMKNGAGIVRFYMNKPKMDLLRKTINDSETESDVKIKCQKELDTHISERQAYKLRLIDAMNKEYKFSKIYFMHDYETKVLKSGTKSGIFINGNGEVDPSITLKEDYIYIIARDNKDDNLVIQNLENVPFPSNFPTKHSRSILSIIDVIFQRKKGYHLEAQVAKLSNALDNFFKKNN